MKTSLIGVLLLAILCTGAQPDFARVNWRPAPHRVGDIVTDPNWLIVPKTGVYEVVPSQLGSSPVRDLPETGFKELIESQAKWLTGHYYTCPSGMRPFLVRAVYHEGFGRFRVERRGKSLAVVWGSFSGAAGRAMRQSALIVNLDFTPDEIYNESSMIPTMP